MKIETRAYLFAHPAQHSLSPIMHNAALRALNIPARYEAVDVAPNQLEAALNTLRTSNIWGVNLSIPHKETAFEFMDVISDEAKSIGAINTVIVRDQKLFGYNTDASGFLRSIQDAGLNPNEQHVVVLGAGGAARGVCYALKQAGAVVTIWNRTPERAQALAQEFELDAYLTDDLLQNAIHGSSGLVNTTSVGLEQPNQSPVAPDLLPMGGKSGSQWVCDIVYKPLETKLLRSTKASNILGIDGLGMLVHQGALALEMWLEAARIPQLVPRDVMRAAALTALQH